MIPETEVPIGTPDVPDFVYMVQARLALKEFGLLDSIDAFIASMPSPQKENAQIKWEFSTYVHRTDDLVVAVAAALNLSEETLDTLFTAASKI